MRVLLLGSGGRESALAWSLARSPLVTDLFAAPGNPGIGAVATVERADITDPGDVLALARRLDVALIVVGPEAPLVAGVADALRADDRLVFGPDTAAARIEGSKSYAKELMAEAGIPTGRGRGFTARADALAFMDELGPPYVIKADGLAAGKGVVVTRNRDEAVAALDERLVQGRFGDAGQSVVIEEFLAGQEASVIAFSDGTTAIACQPAQDYKRVFDSDAGPNTGGMGSYSPVPACPPEVVERITAEIIQPMVAATARRGAPFVGALYAGVALTELGPKVIEFNARFGDPETQVLMPRLTSDVAELFLACARGELAGATLEWSAERCVSLVLACRGYPGSYQTGTTIEGIDDANALDDVEVFHSGTAREGDRVVTAGGRVLSVSARGDSFAAARARAYDAAGRIHFEGKHLRSDIGLRAERWEGEKLKV